MVTNMVWELLKMGVTSPGVGYCRPSVNLFDPGFREAGALRVDGGMSGGSGRDGGNDPRGVMDRYALQAKLLGT